MSTPLTLRLIGLTAFCSMASMRICDPMLIELGREFNVSTGDASQVISVFAIAYGLMQLIYGPLGDRIGKLRVITLATFACVLFLGQSLGVLVMAWSTDGGTLAWAFSLAALGIAALGAWVSRSVQGRRVEVG